MQGLKCCATLAMAAAFLAGGCRAEDKPEQEPKKFYRLDFLVKETDGSNVINSRSYSMQVQVGGGSADEIRTGSKVPFESSTGKWEQIDVGTAISCLRVKEQDGEVVLNLAAEVSSALPNPDNTSHPIVRQHRWRSDVTLKLRKSTVVFSSDDVASKHQMQLEITAIPISPGQ